MLVHVDARHRALSHPHARRAIPGDQSAKELEQVGVVSYEKNVLAIGILIDELLEIGEACADVQRRADLNFGVVTEFVADKLRCLKGALQLTGDNNVGLNLEGAEKAAHQHALLLAIGDKAAFGVELRTFTGNSGIGMPH